MKKKHFHKKANEWFKAVIVAGGIILFLRYFIFIPISVAGDSMSPTLTADHYIIYHPSRSIERFDIVLFYDSQGEAYLKRVIGLPGETLVYESDQLYINGNVIPEPYLEQNRKNNQLLTPDFTLESLVGVSSIPEDSYFVMGDNRPRSKDSRMFGFVPQQSIKGKASMVIYPFDSLAVIR